MRRPFKKSLLCRFYILNYLYCSVCHLFEVPQFELCCTGKINFMHQQFLLSEIQVMQYVAARTAVFSNEFHVTSTKHCRGATHFVGVFISFPTNIAAKFLFHLLSFLYLQMRNLSLFKSSSNLWRSSLRTFTKINGKRHIYTIPNECNTNKAISKICDVPLVVYGSHRFNLPKERFIENDQDLFNLVNEILQKIKSSTLSAGRFWIRGLCKKTKTLPRLSPIFVISHLYQAIRQHFLEFGCKELDNLCLSSSKTQHSTSLLRSWRKLSMSRKHHKKTRRLILTCELCLAEP